MLPEANEKEKKKMLLWSLHFFCTARSNSFLDCIVKKIITFDGILHGGWSEVKQKNNIKTYGWWGKSSTTISWILVKPEQQRSIARKSIKPVILISLYWLTKMNQSFSMTMFCRWVQKLNEMVCKITSPNLLTWLLFDSLTLFQASQQFPVLKRKNKKPLKLSENVLDSKNSEF